MNYLQFVKDGKTFILLSNIWLIYKKRLKNLSTSMLQKSFEKISMFDKTKKIFENNLCLMFLFGIQAHPTILRNWILTIFLIGRQWNFTNLFEFLGFFNNFLIQVRFFIVDKIQSGSYLVSSMISKNTFLISSNCPTLVSSISSTV